MSLVSSLVSVRFYTEFDPYFYTVDNRPLSDLNDNLLTVANQVDSRVSLVDITGAGSPTTNFLPSGWSVSRTSTGIYVITHNLGTTDYSVVSGIINSTAAVAFITATTTNTFTIKTTDLSATVADVRFTCIVSQYYT